MTKPFNMAAFATKDSAKMELMNLETDEGTGVYFELLGADSDEFIMAAQKLMKSTGGKDLDLVKAKAGQNGLLAAITVGWDDISLPEEVNGVPAGESFPFSKGNAEALYNMFPAIREQVDGFVSVRANFIKK